MHSNKNFKQTSKDWLSAWADDTIAPAGMHVPISFSSYLCQKFPQGKFWQIFRSFTAFYKDLKEKFCI